MDGQYRKNIRPGLRVAIVLKRDQRTGRRTVGVVNDILTSPRFTRAASRCGLRTGRSAECGRSSPRRRATRPGRRTC